MRGRVVSAGEQRLASIRKLSPQASVVVDGAVQAFFLPEFRFRVGAQIQTSDLLLYPGPHNSYPSRLFFRNRIECTRSDGSAPNWQDAVIAGSKWFSPSWTGVSAELPLPAMLTAHLRALQ